MFSGHKYLYRINISSFALQTVLVATATYCEFYIYYQASNSYFYFIDEKTKMHNFHFLLGLVSEESSPQFGTYWGHL